MKYCTVHPDDERCQVLRKQHMTMHGWMRYCGEHHEDTNCRLPQQSAVKDLEVSKRRLLVPKSSSQPSDQPATEKLSAREIHERQCKENPYLRGCHTGHIIEPPSLPGSPDADAANATEKHEVTERQCKENPYLKSCHTGHVWSPPDPTLVIPPTKREDGNEVNEKRSVTPFTDFDRIQYRRRPGVDDSALAAQREREREGRVVFQPPKGLEGKDRPSVAFEQQSSAFHSERPGDYPDRVCAKVQDEHCVEWSDPAHGVVTEEQGKRPSAMDVDGPDEPSKLPGFRKRDAKKEDDDIWSMDVHDLVCVTVERETMHCTKWVPLSKSGSMMNWKSPIVQELVAKFEQEKKERKENMEKERIEREEKDKLRARCEALRKEDEAEGKQGGVKKVARKGVQDAELRALTAVAEDVLAAVEPINGEISEIIREKLAELRRHLHVLKGKVFKAQYSSTPSPSKSQETSKLGASKTQDSSTPEKTGTRTRRSGGFPTSILKTPASESAYKFWNCLNQHGQLDFVEWSKEHHSMMEVYNRPNTPFRDSADPVKEKAALEKCFMEQMKHDIEQEQKGKGRSKFLQDFLNEALHPEGMDPDKAKNGTTKSKGSSETQGSSKTVKRDGLIYPTKENVPESAQRDLHYVEKLLDRAETESISGELTKKEAQLEQWHFPLNIDRHPEPYLRRFTFPECWHCWGGGAQESGRRLKEGQHYQCESLL